MDSQNRITIVSVCDNHYIVLLAVLIKSIEINHKSAEKVDYYIVDDGISISNKKKMEASVRREIITLHWLKISDVIPKNAHIPFDSSTFPLNIYVRLFIPYFIPQELHKVLYLDVDMLVLEDIAKLWSVNIGDKTIGAVIDRPEVVSNLWGGILNYKELGLSPDTKYFNSGLLLINPVKWRAKGIANKVLDCIEKNLAFANYPDQYGLNVIFANQWFELDILWNCHSTSNQKKPYLIHFSGRKPIYKSYSNNEAYRAEFNKYIKLTSWQNFKSIGEATRLSYKIYIKIKKLSFKVSKLYSSRLLAFKL